MQAKQMMSRKLLCAQDTYLLSYLHGQLLVSKPDEPDKIFQKQEIGTLANCLTLIERALRLEPRCAIPAEKGNVLISYNGVILNYSLEKHQICVEHQYSRGMKNPLSFCSWTDEKSGKTRIYYGEYIWNTDHGPVAIYRREDGEWQKIYEFPANVITHIHNIVHDQYRHCFLILTGDQSNESGIWFADESFNCVTALLIGKQSYRACVAIVTEEGVYYATDTPLEKNGIYFLTYDKDGKNAVASLITPIPGPCIYGAYLDGNAYFSTSVEPDSTLPAWRYRLTFKLGKGVQDRYAHIMAGNREVGFSEIFKKKKDHWPMLLFQFGNMLFPYNTTDTLYFTIQALTQKHGVTYQLSKEVKADG